MPEADPLRFLLRALVFLAFMLALWWLILLNPLLAGLRLCAELTLRLLPGGSSVSHVTIGRDRNRNTSPLFSPGVDKRNK